MTMKLIDFMGKRRIAYIISILLTILAIGSLAVRQLNLGMDFAGGTQVEVSFAHEPDIDQVRQQVEHLGQSTPTVQATDTLTHLLITLHINEEKTHLNAQQDAAQNSGNGDIGQKVATLLSSDDNPAQLVKAEHIGANVGAQLRDQGSLGLIFALLGIMAYLALRFQWKFALGAVLALTHDVLIVIGLFSLLGLEFNLTVMAGVLAVLGYSLNDTIVVYDRIRENIRNSRSHDIIQICNDAINQTLARTIATSGTTLLALCALYTMGGEMLHNFSLALIFGVVLGTFSSIYVAAALLVLFKLRREDLATAKHDNAP